MVHTQPIKRANDISSVTGDLKKAPSFGLVEDSTASKNVNVICTVTMPRTLRTKPMCSSVSACFRSLSTCLPSSTSPSLMSSGLTPVGYYSVIFF